jgi:hypothetical protein
MFATTNARRPISRVGSQLSAMLQYMSAVAGHRKMSSSIDATRLFKEIEARFPERWRENGWYLSTVSAIFPEEIPEVDVLRV